jgi:hypothetical protein
MARTRLPVDALRRYDRFMEYYRHLRAIRVARLDWAEENGTTLTPEDRHFSDRLTRLMDAMNHIMSQLTGVAITPA